MTKKQLVKPPTLPISVTGISQQVLASFTDQEINDVVSQCTDRLVESMQYMGSSTPVDYHHRTLLVHFKAEQTRRRDNLLAKYGDVDL